MKLPRWKNAAFIRFGCGLAGWWLTLSTLSALPWVMRSSVTGTDLQSEYDRWTAAPYLLRLTRLSGSESSGGAARYTMIFEKSAKTTHWAARSGMTEGDFLDYNTSVQASGYRLVWLDGFGVGSTAYYNGIWEQTGGAAQRVQLGRSLATHQMTNTANEAADYYRTDASSFSVGGTALHAGVWTLASRVAPDIEYRFDQSSAAYQSSFNALNASGYSLWRVSGYSLAGSERFASVWRRSGLGEGWAIHGMDAGTFTAQELNAEYQGYRPAFIDAYTMGTETFYNATWVRDGGLPGSRLGAIAAEVGAYMTDHGLPGLSLAIAHQGRLVYARGFGYADTASAAPAHPLHRWRIASTSKTVAAVAALRALEDSASWGLDSKAFGSGALFASDYGDTTNYPYSANEKAITLRQLMTHTSGWNNDGALWYESAPGYGTDHSLILDYQLNSVPPSWTPGTHYAYNNCNYQAVSRIPEKITGQTFANYCSQQIFQPCGMTSMVLGARTAAGKASLEVSYYQGNIYGDPETVWPARMDGSTGWVCRPSDLLLMARRIDGNARHSDIIGAYALSQMQMANGQIDSKGNYSGYGLGWYPSGSGSNRYWQHNGSMAGTQALLAVREDGEYAMAYATNSVHGDPNPDDSVSVGDAFSGAFRALVVGQIDDITAANQWPDLNLSGTYNSAYDAWADAAFGALTTGRIGLREIWAPNSDPDEDGRSNALEAYLGSDPVSPDRPAWASVYHDGTYVITRWTRKLGYRGVEAAPQLSSTLTTWINVSEGIIPRTDVIVPIGSRVEEARTVGSVSRRFLRLELSTP